MGGKRTLLYQTTVAIVGADVELLALGLRVSIITCDLRNSCLKSKMGRGPQDFALPIGWPNLTFNFSVIARERGFRWSAVRTSVKLLVCFEGGVNRILTSIFYCTSLRFGKNHIPIFESVRKDEKNSDHGFNLYIG